MDEIKAEKGAGLEVCFHPGVDFEAQEDFVLLAGKKGKMVVIPVAEEAVSITKGKHASHYINATNDFFLVPYFDIEMISDKEKTEVATIILPIKDMEEAKQIVANKEIFKDNSGNLTISFSSKGEKYAYEFENRKGGLVFKK